MDFKDSIINALKKQVKTEVFLEIPPNSELGDYAFPCFNLAKEMKKNPVMIAKELADKLKINGIENIRAIGPYVNFFVDKSSLAADVIKKILKEKQNYGKEKRNEKIAIEHTSLNPNSSPHVGRARNAFIGDSIARILKFLGNKVTVYYYINDVSKQVAMLALNFTGKETFSGLIDKYIKVNEKIKDNPELEKKIFELLELFESGDKKTIDKFKKIVKIAIDGQLKIMSQLDIDYDVLDYESSYIKSAREILTRLQKTGKLFTDDEGRQVLNQEGFGLEQMMKNPVLVLARSNGTALYALRDIAYTLDKLNRNKKSIIVLGEDQKLYFKQIQAALKILKENSPEAVHYSYVLISEDGDVKKMSTRKGDVVLLDEFMKEAEKKAAIEIKKRKTKGNSKDVAYAAIKYSILKNSPEKNIIFNWDNALTFEGDTGPYIQYSYARASSILRKVKKKAELKSKNLEPIEKELLMKLSQFPDIVKKAGDELNPSIIANYSFSLAKVFNEFYHACPVIGSDNEGFRIALVEAVKIVIKNSLGLLGINAPEEM